MAFREKPSKLVDLLKTSNFLCKVPCFRVLTKFLAKCCKKYGISWKTIKTCQSPQEVAGSKIQVLRTVAWGSKFYWLPPHKESTDHTYTHTLTNLKRSASYSRQFLSACGSQGSSWCKRHAASMIYPNTMGAGIKAKIRIISWLIPNAKDPWLSGTHL